MNTRGSASLPYPIGTDIAYYIVRFSCDDDLFCQGITNENFQYLKNNGSYGFGAEHVLPENLPDEIDLILAYAVGDIDDDSISDTNDNCITETNHTQADLDGDGVGDKCDDDTDGDGLPDEWEIFRGLNPRSANDAHLDPDGDGYTNTQEYELGFDPLTQDTDTNNNGISDRIENGLKVVPMLKTLLLRKKE